MATSCAVSRSSIFLVSDIQRVFSLTCLTFSAHRHEGRTWVKKPVRHCRHFCSTSKLYCDKRPLEEMLIIEYKRGLPQIRVPLPSSSNGCLFTLRPITNTVGDFLNMIKKEDQAVGSVFVSTKGDVRIASSNSIEDLILDDFKLTINEKNFIVKAPDPDIQNKIENLERLSDVRALVNQLYTALNVSEHVIKKEKDLADRLEKLKTQLEPLEKKKMELDSRAFRKTNAMTWMGLGLMSMQFGILARLTWWEYSWDIMEPVTYFVTYGTAMAAYAYFVLTKQEYLLPDVRDRQHLIDVHKRANKIGLNLDEYNRLKSQVAHIEMDLRRIRDPLNPYVPPLSGEMSLPLKSRSGHLEPLSRFERAKDYLLSLFGTIRKK